MISVFAMKICRYSLVVLLLLVLFSGCTSRYKVDTVHDMFDGYTVNRMSNNILGGGGYSDSVIALNIQQTITKAGEISYHLIVEYWDNYFGGWLYIEGGETLVLLVDGKRMGFSGEGSVQNRSVSHGGAVSEKALYPVSLEDLHTIANAQVVDVKIIGGQGFVQRYFTDKNFKNFQDFLATYVEPVHTDTKKE